jgi:hypothetical protein
MIGLDIITLEELDKMGTVYSNSKIRELFDAVPLNN